jgi:tricorn protease
VGRRSPRDGRQSSATARSATCTFARWTRRRSGSSSSTLAANRTKKALVIDQRFNGGGGIDQELLQILSGREYQYTVGRDAGVRQPRPQNFYGPMVVMQNERSASDAEMFPAGFRALGLGKVIGVPTMGAVIGTGSYTLLDGSAIRTPGSGVWITRAARTWRTTACRPT